MKALRRLISICLFAFYVAQGALAQTSDPAAPVRYNSIMTERILVPGVFAEPGYASVHDTSKITTTEYLDGFGRTLATINKRASLYGKDVIQLQGYDALGRPDTLFLPYVAGTGSGYFTKRSQILHDQKLFYEVEHDRITSDDNPFSVTLYEPSQLNKIKEQGAPGLDWQPGQHTVKTYTRTNLPNEFRLWKADLTSSGYYAAGELLVTEVTDENGNKNINVTDVSGTLLEKHIQASQSPVSWLKTLYIYDIFGRPTYILQPQGVKLLGSGSTISTTLAQQFGFYYKYDSYDRVVAKHEPGTDSVFYCYDPLGRLSLSQNASQRALNKWIFVKYNKYNSVVVQGVYTNTTLTTRKQMQDHINTLNYLTGQTYFEEKVSGGVHGYTNRSFPTDNIEHLIINYYDDYDLDGNGSDDYNYVIQSLQGEGAQFKTSSALTATKSVIMGSTNWLVAYLFYDKDGQVIQTRSNNHMNLTPENLQTNVYDFTGRVTISKKYHKTSASTIVTVVNRFLFDHLGRLKKVFQRNNADTEQVLASYEYNDLGQLVTKNLHCLECPEAASILQGKTFSNYLEKSAYVPGEKSYIARHDIRLLPGFTITPGNSLSVRIAPEQMDSVYATKYMQSIDYRYGIRGWLESINNAELSYNPQTNDDTNDYFGAEILRNEIAPGLNNQSGDTQYWNGNISAMKWKGPGSSNGEDDQIGYRYLYDQSGRLLHARSQIRNNNSWSNETNALSEALTYDDNGNIKTLARNQRAYTWNVAEEKPEYISNAIDNLTYTYTSGNKLEKVDDSISGSKGFIDGITAATEYTYDVMGRITSDKNKGIDSIRYNILGKLSRIKFTDGKVLTYQSDAAGNKLQMKVFQGSQLKHTKNYIQGFSYNSDTLAFFGSPEGRVVLKTSGQFEYQYAIKDHLGNTRVLFTAASSTAEISFTNFESATNTNFLNYPTGGNKSQLELFDHTDFSGSVHTSSQLLNGGYNSQVGVAKSFKVYPGDKVKIEAYGKYFNPQSTASNITGFAAQLTTAFGVTSSSVGEALRAYNQLNDYGSFIASGIGGDDGGGYPKLFVTILLYDKDHNFLDAAWDQIDGGEQVGVTPKAAHDLLSAEVDVKEAGFAYVYVSNESPTMIDFYVDDVTITHTPTNIIQYNEYYPFGLQAGTSWTRENQVPNQYLYNQGSELNENTGWYEMFYRTYDPILGRMLQIDPLAAKYNNLTPYNYAFNDPAGANDPSGAESVKDWAARKEAEWDILDKYGFAAWSNYASSGSIYGWGSYDQMNQTTRSFGMELRNSSSSGGDRYSTRSSADAQRIIQLLQDGYGIYWGASELGYLGLGKGELDVSGGIIDVGIPPEAFDIEVTQGGDLSVSQAGLLSDGASSTLDLLIGAASWRLGRNIEQSKGWFKGKQAWGSGWKLNTRTVNVKMPAPIPNFRIGATAAMRTATALKIGGGLLGAYGLYNTYDDFASGKISGEEAALDAAFGVIGFLGPWGMAASATYFLVAKPLYNYITSDGN